MNVGHSSKLASAFKADSHMGRIKIASMIEQDRMRREVTPRLAPITFAGRRLPGEDRWARERVEPKVIE